MVIMIILLVCLVIINILTILLMNKYKKKNSLLENQIVRNLEKTRVHNENLSTNTIETSATINQMAGNISSIESNMNIHFENIKNSVSNVIIQKQKTKDTIKIINVIFAKTNNLYPVIDDQKNKTDTILTAVEELTQSINNIGEITGKAKSSSINLLAYTKKNKEIVRKISVNIKDFLESVNNINEFIKIIVNISSQTNLLAMNASIEAAHAGEYGKGFSVVADEIRKLSEMSNEQSGNAKKILKDVTSKIKAIADDIFESEKLFDDVYNEANMMETITSEINASTGEQLIGVKEILNAINSFHGSTAQVKTNYNGILSDLGDIQKAVTELFSVTSKNEKNICEIQRFGEELTRNISEMSAGSREILKVVANLINMVETPNKTAIKQ